MTTPTTTPTPPAAGDAELFAARADDFAVVDDPHLPTMTAEHYFPRFRFRPVERAAVPAEIAATLEFKSACPASAVAMAKPLQPLTS